VSAIDIDRHRAVTITFDDGRVHAFTLDELRSNCPCATCRAARDAGRDPAPGSATIEIADASLVGAWGISFSWSDGHATGIYPWESLSVWADR